MTEQENKQCNRCYQIKPTDAFYRSSNLKDGHSYYCKECAKSYAKKWKNTDWKTRLANKSAKAATKKESDKIKFSKIAKMYLSGKTMEECGKAFNCSREWVRLALVALKIKKRRCWAKPKVTVTPEQRLQIKINKFWDSATNTDKPNECWEWQGLRYPTGYGRFGWKGRSGYAHRVAYELANGTPPTLHILHSCDNPPCINPLHLREGTPTENMRDRDDRGRAAWQKDYQGWKAKLLASGKGKFSPKQIKEIRKRAANGEKGIHMAKEFSVATDTIYRIIRGNSYSYLPGARNKHQYQASE